MTMHHSCSRYDGSCFRQRVILNGGWLIMGIVVAVVVLFPCAVMSMDIKWTPNDNNENEAATAPRSQKYWDEHNVKRPDYAKTDWEIAQEKMKDDPNSVRLLILLSIVGLTLLFFSIFIKSNQHAYRLGTTTQDTKKNRKMPFQDNKLTSQEALRQARIEMFEKAMKQQNKEHTD